MTETALAWAALGLVIVCALILTIERRLRLVAVSARRCGDDSKLKGWFVVVLHRSNVFAARRRRVLAVHSNTYITTSYWTDTGKELSRHDSEWARPADQPEFAAIAATLRAEREAARAEKYAVSLDSERKRLVAELEALDNNQPEKQR